LEPAGPSRELALAYIRLSGLYAFDLDGPPAEELAQKAIDTAAAAGAEDMRIWALNFLGLARAYQGDYEASIALLEQSAREALDGALYNIAGNALHNLFGMYIETMEMDKLEQLVPRLEAIKLERWGTLSRLFVASVLAHQTGCAELGLQAAQELQDRAGALGDENAVRSSRLSLAMCCLELARYDQARAYLVAPSADSQVQDAGADAWAWMRVHLATGEVARALEGADFLFAIPTADDNDDGALAAVETFLAAGRDDDANKVLAVLEEAASPLAHQGANEARARVALARGDTAVALASVGEAVGAFHRAGMVWRELKARLFLAQVHATDDDASAAENEFRSVLDTARRLGLVRLEGLAKEGLGTLGIAVEPAAASPEKPGTLLGPAEMGERLVTVMFADVRGYTAMVGERAPVETVDLVGTYQRWAAHEVERHFGVVDKFAGDAVMATFNVSGDQVDHAAHALKAALALRDKASMLGLPVGIGIATGSAVVGTLTKGANLSVIGETTNLASRLQSQAGAGEVLLSEESFKRVREGVHASPEQLSLKGFDGPVAAYRIAAST
jgi:adenylate cyclase